MGLPVPFSSLYPVFYVVGRDPVSTPKLVGGPSGDSLLEERLVALDV